jgi:hypothetical protein
MCKEDRENFARRGACVKETAMFLQDDASRESCRAD